MKYRKYLCDYWHEGARWSIVVKATSFKDAEARLRQMYYGKVAGTLEMEIPAFVGNWAADAICWLRNWARL